MSKPVTICVEELTDPEEGAVWRELPRTKGIRRRLKLTVEQFAERYCIPAELVRSWETGTATPDTVAEAYLRVIAAQPAEVAAALGSGRKVAAE